jgi:hypothetical protein
MYIGVCMYMYMYILVYLQIETEQMENGNFRLFDAKETENESLFSLVGWQSTIAVSAKGPIHVDIDVDMLLLMFTIMFMFMCIDTNYYYYFFLVSLDIYQKLALWGSSGATLESSDCNYCV